MTQPDTGTREVARLSATIYPRLAPNFGSQLSRQLGSAAAQMTVGSNRSFHRVAQTSGNTFIRGFSTTVSRGSGMVDSVIGAIAKPVTAGLAAVGGAAAAATATAIVGGFKRLKGLQDAAKRFDSMGVSIKDTDRLMKGMNKTLLGTPYALDQGAASITGLVTASTPLDKVNKRFGLIVDAAAFAQAPLNEVADIFTKITAEGKLTGERLNQFQTRGVPALSLLASAAGVTGEEMRDMISAGEISADKFFTLWEKGAKGFGDENIRMTGAAQKMGETVTGAWMNMRTAISRTGAKFLESSGIFDLVHVGLTSFMNTVDSLGPAIERMGERVKASLASLGVTEFLEGMPERIKSIGEGIAGLASGGKAAGGALAGLAAGGALAGAGALGIPFLPAIGPLGVLLTTVTGLIAASPELRASFSRILAALVPLLAALGESFFNALAALLEALLPSLVTVLDLVAAGLEFLARNASWAAPLILGVAAAFKILNFVMALNPIGLIVLAIAALVLGILWLWHNVDWFRNGLLLVWEQWRESAMELFYNVLLPAFRAVSWFISNVLGPAFTWLWQNVVQPTFQVIGTVAMWLFNNVLRPGFNNLVFLIQTFVLPAIQVLWTVVSTVFRGIATVVMWLFNTIVLPLFRGWVTYLQTIVFPVLTWLWQNVFGPVFRGIGAIVSFVWTSIIAPVFGFMMGFIRNQLAPTVTFLGGVFSTIWNAIAAVIRFVWTTIILPVFNAIVAGITRVGGWIRAFYNTVVLPIWTAVGNIIRAIWNNVIRPTFNFITAGLTRVGQFVSSLYNNTVNPMFAAIGRVIKAAWDNVIKPTFNFIKDGIQVVAKFISDRVDDVLGFFTDLADGIRNRFNSAMKIGKAFAEGLIGFFADIPGKIRDALNQAIGFLKKLALKIKEIPGVGSLLKGAINVLNNIPGAGVIKNVVRGLPSLPNPFGRAQGGPVWGRGTSSSDSIPAWLSNGEFVMRASAVDKVGMGNMHAINDGRVEVYPPGFQTGGSVNEIIGYAAKSGVPTRVTSSYRTTPDYHGQGMAVDFGGFSQHTLARHFEKVGTRLLELIHTVGGGGYYIKNGRPVGAYAAAEHANHVHVAAPPGFSTSGNALSAFLQGGGGGNFVTKTWRALAEKAWGALKGGFNKVLAPLDDVPFGPAVAKLATSVPEKLFGWLDKKDPGQAIGASGLVGASGSVMSQAYKQARAMGASKKVMMALFAAGFVESGFRNLGHQGSANDHDSLGFLQQRPSSGWGTPAQIMNVPHATRSFVSRAMGIEDRYSSFGNLAQAVQISAFPLRYQERRADALAAIRRFDPSFSFDKGGWLKPGETFAHSNLSQPEAVLTGPQWDIQQRLANRPMEVHIHGKGVALEDLIDIKIADHDDEWVRVVQSQ